MDKTTYVIRHWHHPSRRPHPRAMLVHDKWCAQFSPREVLDLARIYDVMVRRSGDDEIFLDEPGGLFRIRG